VRPVCSARQHVRSAMGHTEGRLVARLMQSRPASRRWLCNGRSASMCVCVCGGGGGGGIGSRRPLEAAGACSPREAASDCEGRLEGAGRFLEAGRLRGIQLRQRSSAHPRSRLDAMGQHCGLPAAGAAYQHGSGMGTAWSGVGAGEETSWLSSGATCGTGLTCAPTTV